MTKKIHKANSFLWVLGLTEFIVSYDFTTTGIVCDYVVEKKRKSRDPIGVLYGSRAILHSYSEDFYDEVYRDNLFSFIESTDRKIGFIHKILWKLL